MTRRKRTREERPHPRRLDELDGIEFWLTHAYGKKPVVTLVLPLRDGYPAEVKDALTARIRADLHGRCSACGARFGARGRLAGVPDATHHAVIRHEPDCPASDGGLQELAERYGVSELLRVLDLRERIAREMFAQEARAHQNAPLVLDLRDVPREERGRQVDDLMRRLGLSPEEAS